MLAFSKKCLLLLVLRLYPNSLSISKHFCGENNRTVLIITELINRDINKQTNRQTTSRLQLLTDVNLFTNSSEESDPTDEGHFVQD